MTVLLEAWTGPKVLRRVAGSCTPLLSAPVCVYGCLERVILDRFKRFFPHPFFEAGILGHPAHLGGMSTCIRGLTLRRQVFKEESGGPFVAKCVITSLGECDKAQWSS